MQRTKPPYRADHVGSLLRSAALKEARAQREANQITDAQLKAIEDREIEAIIKKQEAVGLKSVTDGEYRRAFWNYDFLGKLDGVEAYLGERKISFQGKQPKPMMLRVIGKLGGYVPHPMIEHFKFVQSNTKATPKMTIPSPSTLHFRFGRKVVPESIYPSMDDYYRDLGQTWSKTVVLGLVTSKSGTLESKDEIRRRIGEAAKFVDIDQLCLSPQCGFASTEEGNILAEEEQWAKLRMIVELSEEVWGK